jgi:hypothetical protein
MKTVFDSDVHLNRAIGLDGWFVRVDPEILFPDDVCHASRDGDSNEIAQFDIDAMIAFILFLDIFEFKVERLIVAHLARGGQFL